MRVTRPAATLKVAPGTVVSVKAVNSAGLEGWDWARIDDAVTHRQRQPPGLILGDVLHLVGAALDHGVPLVVPARHLDDPVRPAGEPQLTERQHVRDAAAIAVGDDRLSLARGFCCASS